MEILYAANSSDVLEILDLPWREVGDVLDRVAARAPLNVDPWSNVKWLGR